MPRILLFHNPNAGGRCPHQGIVALLRRAGLDPVYCDTRSPARLDAVLARSADLVVIAGGDGTVTKVITRRRDRRAPYLILPIGTANNIAQSLGLARVPRDLGVALRSFRPRPFYLGFVDGPWGRRRFLEGVGVGAIAEHLARGSVKASSPAEKLMRGRKALSEVVAGLRPFAVRMELDGVGIDEEVLMAEFLNVDKSGPAVPLASRGGRSLLQLVLLGGARPETMRDWLSRLASGEEPVGAPPVSRIEGRLWRLDWQERPLRIDDECFPPPPGLARLTIGREVTPVFVLAPPAASRSI